MPAYSVAVADVSRSSMLEDLVDERAQDLQTAAGNVPTGRSHSPATKERPPS